MQVAVSPQKTSQSVSLDMLPQHIAFIIDGNRRWAKAHGKTVMQGHTQGYKVLKQIADAAFERGIKELSAFVFSTENWHRSKEEVTNLMRLIRKIFRNDIENLHKKGVRIKVSGLRSKVPADILKLIDRAIIKTQHNTKGTLNFCFNYGGRADILEAVKRLIKKGIKEDEINETSFARELSTAGLHDVDLLIRTSEQRLSGFLTWESVYAEIYFLPDKLWPDFTAADLDQAIAVYGQKDRRFGT